MTFDKHVNKVRTEMANDHLFAIVLSCGIPDKGFVDFFVIAAVKSKLW